LGWYAAHRPDVRRDVLADHTVAAGRRTHERTPLVRERAGDAVDLLLARIRDVGAVDRALDAGAPRFHLLDRERVVEGKHRRPVRHRSEQVGGRGPDPLRGRVGRDEFRELVFECDEFLNQLVVLDVGHLRVVEHVIAVRVPVDLLAEFLDAELRIGPAPFLLRDRHAAISTPPASPIRSPTTTTPPATSGTFSRYRRAWWN